MKKKIVIGITAAVTVAQGNDILRFIIDNGMININDEQDCLRIVKIL